MKFIRRKPILETRTMDFPTPIVAFHSLLAKQIFGIWGVKSIVFDLDFTAFINKSEDIDWNLMRLDINATILDCFASCFSTSIFKRSRIQKNKNKKPWSYDNNKELLKTIEHGQLCENKDKWSPDDSRRVLYKWNANVFY